MKRLFAPLAAFVVMVALAASAHAVDTSTMGTSNGGTAMMLATSLYCGTKDILQGYIGLLMGLALVALGLWALIQGRGLAAGLTLIVLGSLVTALPSIVESTASGLGDLLRQAGLSKNGKGLADISCTSSGSGNSGNVDVPNAAVMYGVDPFATPTVTKEYGQQLQKPEGYQPPPPYAAYE